MQGQKERDFPEAVKRNESKAPRDCRKQGIEESNFNLWGAAGVCLCMCWENQLHQAFERSVEEGSPRCFDAFRIVYIKIVKRL